MKKEKCYQVFYVVSIVLILVFCIRLGMDYFKYNTVANSAPFYVFIITRGIEFFLPSLVLIGVAKIVKRKYSKKEK